MSNHFIKKKEERTVYAVPYTDSDEGPGVCGFKIWPNKDRCIHSVRRARKSGFAPDGSYFGPVHPLGYIEVPVECCEPEWLSKINLHGIAFVEGRWEPKYRGNTIFFK